MPPDTLRRRLRAATSTAHQRLDRLWDGANFGARPTYARFLGTMARALLPLERQLQDAGVDVLLPDWPRRRRSPSLADDLAGLDVPVPDALAPEPVRARPDLWGILYVLEGSRLGGKLLLAQVESSADPLVRANCRFLGHGSGAGLWPSFVERLDAVLPPQREVELICERARGTFALFEAAAQAA